MATSSSAFYSDSALCWSADTRVTIRLVNPYVAPVLYVRRPGSDHEETHHFAEDDPFFSEVSVLVDNIEDIEEEPESAQILSSFEGMSSMSGPRSALFTTL